MPQKAVQNKPHSCCMMAATHPFTHPPTHPQHLDPKAPYTLGVRKTCLPLCLTTAHHPPLRCCCSSQALQRAYPRPRQQCQQQQPHANASPQRLSTPARHSRWQQQRLAAGSSSSGGGASSSWLVGRGGSGGGCSVRPAAGRGRRPRFAWAAAAAQAAVHDPVCSRGHPGK